MQDYMTFLVWGSVGADEASSLVLMLPVCFDFRFDLTIEWEGCWRNLVLVGCCGAQMPGPHRPACKCGIL